MRDTPLLKERRNRLRSNREKKKKKTGPGRIRSDHLKSFALQACALPLCYNRSLQKTDVKSRFKPMPTPLEVPQENKSLHYFIGQITLTYVTG